MKKSDGGFRPLMSYVPLVSSVLGITIIISSVVFFWVESDSRRLLFVTIGLAILIAGVWYAANPFLKNTRRYVPLREEVDAFIELVRIVNRQVVEGEGPAAVEGTRAEMHEAVERMVAKAGKSK